MVSAALGLALSAAPMPPDDPRLDWFRQARVGMFIHWGPSSVAARGIGWSRDNGVPAAEYDLLYRRFNPTQFDPDSWMQLARDAGMRYVVPTSKHHDGFCIWPTKTTWYSVTATPFKRDIMGELAAAAKRKGVVFCSYFSILDWWHPWYGAGSPGGRTTKPNPNMPAFMEYAKAQLREVVEGYRPRMLWFDGEWEGPYTPEFAADFEGFVRGLDPAIVVNNRVGKKQTDGDFDTPEQKIGSFQRGRAWETCMTLGTNWSWKINDKIKTPDEVMSILVQTVTGDGNLLLNVGPDDKGVIEPRQADVLRAMGAWLKANGSAVYGTRGGPYTNGAWGGMTCRGRTAFLHLLAWDGQPIRFRPLGARVLRHATLSGLRVLVRQTEEGLTVSAPGAPRLPHALVVRLDLDRDAVALPIVANPKLD